MSKDLFAWLSLGALTGTCIYFACREWTYGALSGALFGIAYAAAVMTVAFFIRWIQQ